MQVSINFYPGPGRGERINKRVEFPDGGFPADQEEALARSVKAVQHYFPFTRQATLRGECRISIPTRRFVCEGKHWSVEWMTDACAKKHDEFFERVINGKASADEMAVFAETEQ